MSEGAKETTQKIWKRKVSIKNIIITVTIVILGIAVFYTYLPLFLNRGKVKRSIDMNIVFAQVEEIAEFATLSCPYTNVATITKETPVLWGGC